jgi:hypothetical protein
MFINLPYYLLFQGYNAYLLSTSMFVVVSDLPLKTASPALHLAKPWQLALLLANLATFKEQVEQHPQVVISNFVSQTFRWKLMVYLHSIYEIWHRLLTGSKPLNAECRRLDKKTFCKE